MSLAPHLPLALWPSLTGLSSADFHTTRPNHLLRAGWDWRVGLHFLLKALSTAKCSQFSPTHSVIHSPSSLLSFHPSLPPSCTHSVHSLLHLHTCLLIHSFILTHPLSPSYPSTFCPHPVPGSEGGWGCTQRHARSGPWAAPGRVPQTREPALEVTRADGTLLGLRGCRGVLRGGSGQGAPRAEGRETDGGGLAHTLSCSGPAPGSVLGRDPSRCSGALTDAGSQTTCQAAAGSQAIGGRIDLQSVLGRQAIPEPEQGDGRGKEGGKREGEESGEGRGRPPRVSVSGQWLCLALWDRCLVGPDLRGSPCSWAWGSLL